jgi:hypothetical protein
MLLHCLLPVNLGSAGAAHLTTIEFLTTISKIPNHKMIRPLEWVRDFRSGALPSVDFVYSFSSLEHDGLGRYGDPIDPWGDVKAMQRASCYVKPGKRRQACQWPTLAYYTPYRVICMPCKACTAMVCCSHCSIGILCGFELPCTG